MDLLVTNAPHHTSHICNSLLIRSRVVGEEVIFNQFSQHIDIRDDYLSMAIEIQDFSIIMDSERCRSQLGWRVELLCIRLAPMIVIK